MLRQLSRVVRAQRARTFLKVVLITVGLLLYGRRRLRALLLRSCFKVTVSPALTSLGSLDVLAYANPPPIHQYLKQGRKGDWSCTCCACTLNVQAGDITGTAEVRVGE